MAMNRLRPAALRDAIESDALSLHYQAQVHVSDGRLSGVEGFVRWPHPAQGLLGPGEVLPLVEEGLLHAVFDGWVLRTLCAQVVRWRDEHVLVPLVAANVWPQTLRHPGVVEIVREALAAGGAAATMLEIELPRGALADPPLAARLREIRRLGVRLASDDLARDPRAPLGGVDTLKLPRGADAEAVARVVAAGRELVARVVAEGVETETERDALVAAGCEIVQGYVYGPEVSADDIRSLVQR